MGFAPKCSWILPRGLSPTLYLLLSQRRSGSTLFRILTSSICVKCHFSWLWRVCSGYEYIERYNSMLFSTITMLQCHHLCRNSIIKQKRSQKWRFWPFFLMKSLSSWRFLLSSVHLFYIFFICRNKLHCFLLPVFHALACTGVLLATLLIRPLA